MRGAVCRAARALLPVALCAVLPLLQTHLATTPLAPDPVLDPPFRNPYDPVTPLPESYRANDTLLGRLLPCTDEEKECLRYNRIYSPLLDRCYALGDGPGRCRFAVDRCEFERTRRVRGVCAPTDLCAPYSKDHVRMAYDGQCVEANKLKSVCGPGPVDIVTHFFGDSECAPAALLESATPRYVPQPEKRGHCAFPNLRHDLTSVAHGVFFRECSVRQSGCFAAQQVWLAEFRGCHTLLDSGPCADGERVVLNRTAWEAGSVEAACAPANPCRGSSASHRLMAFDRRCHDAATVLRALCPGGVLLPNAFGELACATRDYYRHVIELRSARLGTCEIAHRVSHDLPLAGTRVQPECGLVDRVLEEDKVDEVDEGCVYAF